MLAFCSMPTAQSHAVTVGRHTCPRPCALLLAAGNVKEKARQIEAFAANAAKKLQGPPIMALSG